MRAQSTTDSSEVLLGFKDPRRIYSCVFVDYSGKCFYEKRFFSRSHTTCSRYISALRNTPYGKRHTSLTKPVKPLGHILEEKLHNIHSNLFDATGKSLRRILQPEKRAKRRSLLKSLGPSIDQLEKPTSSRATDVVSH